MARIAVLTMSDGRDFVARDVRDFVLRAEDRVAATLAGAGHEGAYHAMRELIDEWHLDFSGIKGQPELTTHFATMDVAEAFLNDPYDWEGPKATHVTATEADMDGALTMQLLKLISGDPVLFADVRHYHSDRDVWDLCNSGQHTTWYAARSDDPLENLARTHLYPEVFYFPAGGASVHHLAAPGEATFARLTRRNGRYRMHVARGRFETYDTETNERMMRERCRATSSPSYAPSAKCWMSTSRVSATPPSRFSISVRRTAHDRHDLAARATADGGGGRHGARHRRPGRRLR